jgi:hypothetical protein
MVEGIIVFRHIDQDNQSICLYIGRKSQDLQNRRAVPLPYPAVDRPLLDSRQASEINDYCAQGQKGGDPELSPRNV